jgi:hypothetical protein
MSAQTARWDLPYSEGTDGVDTIDETMQALAERLDWLLGEEDSDTIQAAGIGTVSKVINYARDYTGKGTPRVTITRTSNHDDTILWVTNETVTSFTINLRTLAAGTAIRSFRWRAMPQES